MALTPEKQARVEQINAALRAGGFENKVGGLAEREALRRELTQIFADDASPPPQVDERVAGLVLRADTLARALYGHRWPITDDRIINRALADTLQQLPDGVWLAPTRSTAPGRLPMAMLPPAVSAALADAGVTGEARENSLSDLTNTLTGLLGPAPGSNTGGDGGAAP